MRTLSGTGSAQKDPARKRQRFNYYLGASVSLLTFIVYLPSLQNEFVNWDDNLYIYDNLPIRSLDTAFLRWAFSTFHASNWHPLTWISHALDYAIWELNPLGHHLTNNILHAVNTFIVVVLVIKLIEVWRERARPGRTFLDEGGMLIAGGMTGLLFGLHPLHVESVAWVSERKDLLCAMFFLLSTMMYVKYARRGGPMWPPKEGQPQRVAPTQKDPRQAGMRAMRSQFLSRYYLLSLFFFALALMSKPMAVSLPVVLLILDWHPCQRVNSLKTFWAALVEKLPFIAFSIISSILTIVAQKAGGAMRMTEVVPLETRMIVAAGSLLAYLRKMVLPLNLLPFYRYRYDVSLASPEYLLSVLGVAGITVVASIFARRQRIWLAVWGFYVVTLLPVLGIVQAGIQSMADRYAYLPSLGPFLIAGLIASWVMGKVNAVKRGRVFLTVALAAATLSTFASLSYVTVKQSHIWKNDLSLWNHVIEHEHDRVPFAYYNRALAFERMAQDDKAIEDYSRAIALDPFTQVSYNNLGALYLRQGLLDKALQALTAAVSLQPNDSRALDNRGWVYFFIGDYARALEDFTRAIALKPGLAQFYFDRATAYVQTGQQESAALDFRKACELGDGEGCKAYKTLPSSIRDVP